MQRKYQFTEQARNLRGFALFRKCRAMEVCSGIFSTYHTLPQVKWVNIATALMLVIMIIIVKPVSYTVVSDSVNVLCTTMHIHFETLANSIGKYE